MSQTAEVRRVEGGWRVYVYGYRYQGRKPKSFFTTFNTKAAAQKAAKEQRKKHS